MEAAIEEYRPKPKPKKDDFWKALGLPARGAQLHEALEKGVPYKVSSQRHCSEEPRLGASSKTKAIGCTALPRSTRALLISLKEINSGRGAGSSIRCAVSVVGDRWKWWRRLLALKLCWI